MKTNEYCCTQLMLKAAGWVTLAFLMICSCKNDYETINALTNELKIPDQAGYDVEIVYHDSGWIKGKIVTPEVNNYNRVSDPYTEFPQGLKVYFYDRNENIEYYIEAKYAIYYQERQLWEARNKVLAENPTTGEMLETEQLFWDQENKTIYSDKFSKITNADGIFYGENGFDATEDLDQWELKGSKGTAILRDEQEEEQDGTNTGPEN